MTMVSADWKSQAIDLSKFSAHEISIVENGEKRKHHDRFSKARIEIARKIRSIKARFMFRMERNELGCIKYAFLEAHTLEITSS